MATMNAPIPLDVQHRIFAAGTRLGQFRRTFEDNEHNTTGSNLREARNCFILAVIAFVVNLVTLLVFHVYFVKLVLIVPLFGIFAIVLLIRGLLRGRGGRDYVGVFDGGLVGAREKSEAVAVVPFATGKVSIRSYWSGGNWGRRAKYYVLTARQGDAVVRVHARTDAAMIELNDVLTRFPQQCPIQRVKEHRYAGA